MQEQNKPVNNPAVEEKSSARCGRKHGDASVRTAWQ